MPRLVYEYLYVNFWILFLLAIFWVDDGDISSWEGLCLIIFSVIGLVAVGKKQLRPTDTARFRKPFS